MILQQRLTGYEVEQLQEALLDAFVLHEFQQVVFFALNIQLQSVVDTHAPFRDVAFDLLLWADRHNKLRELFEKAVKKNSDNRALQLAAAEVLHVNARTEGLEAIVSRNPEPFSDPEQFRDRMAACERAVCRVEQSGEAIGTGFLMGPDLVMTCRHVWDCCLERGAEEGIRFAFGYRVLPNGSEAATRYGPTKDPAIQRLVAQSPAAELDFVLVRLEDRAGEATIGDYQGAPKRQWLTPKDHRFQGKEPALILQHPEGAPMKLAFGSVDPNVPAPRRIHYAVDTLPRSSGSPVFLNDWGLVAIHRQAIDRDRNGGVPMADIMPHIRNFLAHSERAPDLDSKSLAPNPAPALPFELDTGAIRLDSPFYVRRPADDMAETQVLKTGDTTLIRAPWQFGKSSLLVRMHARALANEQVSWYFDFQRVNKQYLDDLNLLSRHIAHRMAHELRPALAPNNHWDEHAGPSDNLTDYLEDAFLRDAQTPVQIIFDAIDSVIGSSYQDEFFGMVRAWHDRRVYQSIWRNLNIVIGHYTPSTVWITSRNQSPFNVGTRIRLSEFDFATVSELNRKYGRPLSTDQIHDLMGLVGGHPFLVRAAVYHLATRRQPFSTLREAAADQDGPFSDNLQILLQLLDRDEALKYALRQVTHRGTCDDELHYQRLWAAGLIHGEHRNAVQVRCELYRRYFKEHL